MKFIDSVQPPLALYGDIVITGGRTYYVNESGKETLFKPTKQELKPYKARLHETKKAIATAHRLAEQKAATPKKHHDIKRPRAGSTQGGVTASEAASKFAAYFREYATHATR